jgi:uncharacterized protein YjbJ (UPF0337 family)
MNQTGATATNRGNEYEQPNGSRRCCDDLRCPGSAGAQGTTDKIEGTAKEVQGSVKETVGKATGETKLEWSDTADKVAGAPQNTVGDVKNATGDINGKVANLFTRLGDFVARIF